MKTALKSWYSFVCVAFALLVAGCSTILAPFTPEDSPFGFYPPGVDPRNARSVPADIAQDIQSISEEGVIYRYKPREREEVVKEAQGPVDEVAEDVQPVTKAEPELEVVQEEVPAEPEQPQPVLSGSSGPLARKIANKKAGPLQRKSRVTLKAPSYKGGKTVSHVVKKGDTLMEISFDKHGDYLRWREIYRDNRSKMKHWTKMTVGTVLTINNVKYVYIRKNGKPYFIQRGDTLKTIAQKVYGTPLMWRALWKNNPQLIKNPSKLYAGFTLYYQPKSGQPAAKPEVRKPSANIGPLPVKRIQEDRRVVPGASPQQILEREFQGTD